MSQIPANTNHLPDIIPSGRLPLSAWDAMRAFSYAGCAFLIAAAIGQFVKDEPREHLRIVGFVGGGFMFFASTILLMLGVSWSRKVEHLRRDPILCWTYSEDQWTAYTRQVNQGKRRAPLYVAGFIMASCILAALLNASENSNADGESSNKAVPILIGGLIASLVVGGAVFLFLRANIRKYGHGPGFVLIGEQGFYVMGEFWPVATVGQDLMNIRINTAPEPTLVFTFRVANQSAYTMKDVAIPIPYGKEAEAQAFICEYVDGGEVE